MYTLLTVYMWLHHIKIRMYICTVCLPVQSQIRWSGHNLSSSRYNGSLVTWPVTRLTPPPKFIPLVLLVSGFALSTIANLLHIRDFVWLLLAACMILLCNHIRKEVSKIRVLLKLKLGSYRRSVGQRVLVSGSHLEVTATFFFSVSQLWVSSCSTPSLTRGRVCNLLVQLFLGHTRAVTLGSKSRRTRNHTSLSHLRLPQPGGPGYIPLEQGGPVIPPGTVFPFRRLFQIPGLRLRYSNPRP
jgi:hypothetical protein